MKLHQTSADPLENVESTNDPPPSHKESEQTVSAAKREVQNQKILCKDKNSEIEITEDIIRVTVKQGGKVLQLFLSYPGSYSCFD